MCGLLMLLATGNDISFTASVGLVALIGIEIKNSILLVDFTNQLRAQGVPLDEAIERANDTIYGLHGAVYTQDAEHGYEVARRVRSGSVTVNGLIVDPELPLGLGERLPYPSGACRP